LSYHRTIATAAIGTGAVGYIQRGSIYWRSATSGHLVDGLIGAMAAPPIFTTSPKTCQNSRKEAILMKAAQRIAGITAAVGLVAGFGIAVAPAASATSFVCVALNGTDAGAKCTHQSSLYPNNEWNGGSAWNTADMVLKFQGDGNLVLYCKNGGFSSGMNKYISSGLAVWASGHSNTSWIHPPLGEHLDFWGDGNLATYESINQTAGQLNWFNTWSMNQWPGASGTWIVVQADGNVVEWSNGRATWASNTYHYCPGTENYWNGYR
jgi:hypothetical protein